MVDNVAITAGTGTTIAADDIGAGVLVQRVKATWGPDGTANDTDVATGKPMPIQARHSDGTILSDATGMKISTAQLAALNTTAQAMAAGFQSTDPPTDGTFALRTGSLTETAPVTDTASSGLNGRLQRIAQRITSLLAAPINLAGTPVALSITRTADTNAYLAGDAIGTGVSAGNAVLTFANLRPAGAGEYTITRVEMEVDASAAISGETSYSLYLHNAAPNSNLADNAAFDITSGDRATFIGKLALGVLVDEGSTLYVSSTFQEQITMAGTDLKAYLVTVGAYTPTSARVYKITIHGYPT